MILASVSIPPFPMKLKSSVKTLMEVGTGALSSKGVPKVLN